MVCKTRGSLLAKRTFIVIKEQCALVFVTLIEDFFRDDLLLIVGIIYILEK
jgi:hypothetical protein